MSAQGGASKEEEEETARLKVGIIIEAGSHMISLAVVLFTFVRDACADGERRSYTLL